MTDIERLHAQIDAVGNLAAMRQRAAIAQQQAELARQQAARDAQLAKQNAQVVSLLQEQKRREEAEKARIDALPKCPDCRTPVETDARRCPQCRIELLTWSYASPCHPWLLICRAEEAVPTLQARCDALSLEAAALASNIASEASTIGEGWRAGIMKAGAEIRSRLDRLNDESRETVVTLLGQLHAGVRLATPLEMAKHKKRLIEIDQEHPEERIAEARAEASARQARVGSKNESGCILGFIAIGSCLWGLVALALVMQSWAQGHVVESSDVVGMYVGWSVCCLVVIVRWTLSAAARMRARAAQIAAERAEEFVKARREACENAEAKANTVHSQLANKLREAGYLSLLDTIGNHLERVPIATGLVKIRVGLLKETLSALADTIEYCELIGYSPTSRWGATSLDVRQKAQQVPAIHDCFIRPNAIGVCEQRDVDKVYGAFCNVEAFCRTCTEGRAIAARS